MLTDGLTQGRRLQISGWLIAEDRDTPYDGSAETPNPLQERTSVRTYLVTGDVRLTTMFGLQVSMTMPDVTRSAVVERPGSRVEFSETFQGLGDTSIIAWQRFVSSTGWNMTVNAGVTLPTGKTERPRFRTELDDDSLVPVSRLQRGTGTVDPLLGVSVNRIVTRIFPPGTRMFANAAARLPFAENEFGMRTGATWEIGAGGSREIKFHQLVAIGRVSWLHRNQDVHDGTPILVGGGDWVYFAPAAALSFGPITVQTEFRLPLYRALDNRQLDSSHVFQIGMIWTPF